MITFNEFNTLSEDDKAEEVWRGTFLADRKDGDILVQLVSLHTFYVEIYYEPLENRILRFRAFNSLQLLEPFLKDLKL